MEQKTWVSRNWPALLGAAFMLFIAAMFMAGVVKPPAYAPEVASKK
jgi:hypothetical protein